MSLICIWTIQSSLSTQTRRFESTLLSKRRVCVISDDGRVQIYISDIWQGKIAFIRERWCLLQGADIVRRSKQNRDELFECYWVVLRVYMYIRMYVYMYVCMYVCICMCVYICIYVCMCVYIYVYMYICIYMYVCVYVYMYVCVYVCVYVCMYVCVYVCMYVGMCLCVYIYVCMYIYMYVHIPLPVLPHYITLLCNKTNLPSVYILI
jgi:hypothetical protein